MREINPEALVWSVATTTQVGAGQFPGTDVTKAAKASEWLILYGQERDRLLGMAETAHGMGIEIQRIALYEQFGNLMAEAIRGTLADLDLSAEQQAAAAVAIPRRLALVAGALTAGSPA